MSFEKPKRRDGLYQRILRVYPSQTAFSFAIGENEAFVSKVINGWRLPDPERMKKWAEALNCRVTEIFPEA